MTNNLRTTGHPGLEADPQWDALAARCAEASLFASSSWLCAWAETIGRDARLHVVRTFDGDELVGAAAFEIAGRRARFAGWGPSDFGDVLLAPELSDAAATRVLESVIRAVLEAHPRVASLDLRRMPARSRAAGLLADTGLHAILQPGVETPFMDMRSAPEKLRKKSLRRHENGLSRQGTVTCTTHTTAAATLPRLDGFFDLHIKRWQDTDSPSLFLDSSNRAFYREAARKLEAIGGLRYTELRLNDALVAAHFGFCWAGRFVWYKPCFDPDLAKLSPGEVLLKHLITRALEEGVAIFDFTLGNETFKSRFATEVPRVHNAYVTASAARAGIRKVRHSLRSAYQRVSG